MDNRQRASEWVAMYADNNALARHRQAVDSLTALLDSVRREALVECARICDAHARKHDLSFDAPAARALADRIRAFAPPPNPDDETKGDERR